MAKPELTKEEKEQTYILNRVGRRKMEHTMMPMRVEANGERIVKIHGDLNRKSNRKYRTKMGQEAHKAIKKEDKKEAK